MYHVRFFTGWLQVLLLTSAAAQTVLTPQYLLQDERIGMVASLAIDRDGRLYVADPMNGCIHVFSNGAYLQQIGRPGMGPGEFQVLAALAIHGGQLYALDIEARRLTRFTLDGTVIGTLPIQSPDEELVVSADLLLGAHGLLDRRRQPALYPDQASFRRPAPGRPSSPYCTPSAS